MKNMKPVFVSAVVLGAIIAALRTDTVAQYVEKFRSVVTDTNSIIVSHADLVITSAGGTVSFTNAYALAVSASADALKWDGGTNSLVAATGRTSLGLGTAAESNATAFATAAQGNNKMLWVSTSEGVDATAAVGRSDKPYKTISAAITAASDGSAIVILPGTYNEQIALKDGVDLVFLPGAILHYSGSSGAAITDNGVAVSVSITADEITRSATAGSDDAAAIELRAASSLYITANTIKNTISDGRMAAALFIKESAPTVFMRCVEMDVAYDAVLATRAPSGLPSVYVCADKIVAGDNIVEWDTTGTLRINFKRAESGGSGIVIVSADASVYASGDLYAAEYGLTSSGGLWFTGHIESANIIATMEGTGNRLYNVKAISAYDPPLATLGGILIDGTAVLESVTIETAADYSVSRKAFGDAGTIECRGVWANKPVADNITQSLDLVRVDGATAITLGDVTASSISTTGTVSAASLAVSGTATGSYPTAATQFATKQYVDNVSALLETWYMLASDSSDIAGYYTLSKQNTTQTLQTITSASTTNDHYVVAFATEPGSPAITEIRAGTYDVHFWAAKGAAGAATLTPELYILQPDGTVVAEVESGEATAALTTSPTAYDVSIIVPTNFPVAVTNRIAVKLKATVSSGTPTIYAYTEGERPAYVNASASAGAFLPITGGTLTGALTGTDASFTGAITGGTVNATSYTGSGAALTGLRPSITALSMSTNQTFTAVEHGDTAVVTISAHGFTLTLADPAMTNRPYAITTEFVQGGTTNAVTLAGNITTPGGVRPVLSTTSNAVDVLEWRWTGAKWRLVNAAFGQAVIP